MARNQDFPDSTCAGIHPPSRSPTGFELGVRIKPPHSKTSSKVHFEALQEHDYYYYDYYYYYYYDYYYYNYYYYYYYSYYYYYCYYSE